jgi:hypothetical protein
VAISAGIAEAVDAGVRDAARTPTLSSPLSGRFRPFLVLSRHALSGPFPLIKERAPISTIGALHPAGTSGLSGGRGRRRGGESESPAILTALRIARTHYVLPVPAPERGAGRSCRRCLGRSDRLIRYPRSSPRRGEGGSGVRDRHRRLDRSREARGVDHCRRRRRRPRGFLRDHDPPQQCQYSEHCTGGRRRPPRPAVIAYRF